MFYGISIFRVLSVLLILLMVSGSAAASALTAASDAGPASQEKLTEDSTVGAVPYIPDIPNTPLGGLSGVTVNSPLPPGTPNAPTPAWYDGMIQYSSITNCVSISQGFPYQEDGVGAYVGFLADPEAGLPASNTTYYIHVFIAGLGNSCSGMRAYLDVALPASTSLAIDASNRIYCYFDGVQIAPASDCPQSLPASSYNPGAYSILSTDAAHAYTWSIPQGHTLEFQIPVTSSVPLTNSTLQANIWMLDDNDSPWLHPQQGVYVFGSEPTIIYTSPSTTLVTATSGHSQAYLYTFGMTGTGYFDLGPTTAYELTHKPVPILAGTAWLVWNNWSSPVLTPNTLYHWRFTFTPTSGSPVYGADQTFRTLPDGRITVGNGQAASCTGAAFNSALSTAKEILFDCGPLPVTVTLGDSHSITSNLIIDGGNKVTLSMAGTVNHFDVYSGAHLTLKKITLSNGINPFDCGGAVKVNGGGFLTLNKTRFDNNQSDYQGGAICNWGTTDITNTLFTNNISLSHGGAIGTFSAMSITNSKFVSNTSIWGNGGAVEMGGALTVTNSTFDGNHSGWRGGGINTYFGNLTVTGSSFTGNSAGIWGGGISSDASTTTITGSTFSENSSAHVGGGLETSQAGSLTLINSTVSSNHSINDGGGLFWYTGVGTGPLTIVNSTITGNTSGTQGGNIYVGGIGNYNSSINLKNTIVVSGTPNNCSGTLLSNGNNLEDTNTCGLTAGGDMVKTNPLLGALQNNGGLTSTHAILAGSPAINAGTNSGCPVVDQRGVARPQNGQCDIGSYEYRTPIFADVLDSYWAYTSIERLYIAGITVGCTAGPLAYCPDTSVSRAQMAIFLLRGIHGSAYTPPPATGTKFADVPPGSFGADWIEQLANENLTSGCDGGNYCPNQTVSRAQMAIFLVRARHGLAFIPPPAIGRFPDVPVGSFGADFIEQLVADGITSGCGGGNYCPNTTVKRDSMAVFLVKTFNLP